MPEYFFEQMRELLGGEYADFKRAYDEKPRHKALRVNTKKIAPDAFLRLTDIAARRNPLCENSFYTAVKPSLDPLYHAGLYYMQEPSASAAVAAFAPFIGTRVLDLCSAPGGKATQAAAYMRGGVIFCNDVEQKRIAALRENIERLGIVNATVTRATAAEYVRYGGEEWFDTLIVDAPCSGGGMMRYENVPLSAEIVAGCAKRQREILDSAARLLQNGGYMLYSTCTFSREENEDNIEYMIGKGFATVDMPLRDGETRGIGMPDARRIYPHRFDGEGHFYCVLQKRVGGVSGLPFSKTETTKEHIGGAVVDCIKTDGAILLPTDIARIGVRTVRRGIEVYDGAPAGRCAVRDRRSRIAEVSHALTHAIGRGQIASFGAIELSESDALKYIRGEELATDAPNGTLVATYKGYALGLVKSARSGTGEPVLKNLYPKALRV